MIIWKGKLKKYGKITIFSLINSAYVDAVVMDANKTIIPIGNDNFSFFLNWNRSAVPSTAA